MDDLEPLRTLGLTGTEAALYGVLLREGMATGYEAAQRAGIARANAYQALERLQRRGAVRAVAVGRAKRYEAVPVLEFARQQALQMRLAAQSIEGSIKAPVAESAASAGRGADTLLAKARTMLHDAQAAVHLAIQPEVAPALAASLTASRETGREVVVACIGDCDRPCAVCGEDVRRLPELAENTPLLIVRDREEVLAADTFGPSATFVVVRSRILGGAVAALVQGAERLG